MTEQPEDYEAERRIIGCVILHSEIINDLTLRPEDFFTKELGSLYAAACDLSIEQKPITSRTLSERAGADRTFVYECVEGANATEATFWAERIILARKRRQLLSVASFATRLAGQHDADPDDAMLRTEEMLASFADKREDNESILVTDAVDQVMERIGRYITDPDAISGLPTGWSRFDRLLDGLQPGAVTSVYAKTGMFKSFFAQNIAWRLGRYGAPGAFFSTEMTNNQVMERLLQLESGLNFRDLRYRHELYQWHGAIATAAEELRDLPIWINDRSLLDVQYVRGYLSRLKRTHGTEWAILDLVNHVYSSRFKDNETKNEAFVMQQLKQTAKDLGIHIIVTAHVAKGGRYDAPKSYIDPDDIKGSSAYSQDADTTISLMLVMHNEDGFGFRPMSREERMAAQRAGEPMLVMASVTKNRAGLIEDILFQMDMSKGGKMIVEVDK